MLHYIHGHVCEPRSQPSEKSYRYIEVHKKKDFDSMAKPFVIQDIAKRVRLMGRQLPRRWVRIVCVLFSNYRYSNLYINITLDYWMTAFSCRRWCLPHHSVSSHNHTWSCVPSVWTSSSCLKYEMSQRQYGHSINLSRRIVSGLNLAMLCTLPTQVQRHESMLSTLYL